MVAATANTSCKVQDDLGHKSLSPCARCGGWYGSNEQHPSINPAVLRATLWERGMYVQLSEERGLGGAEPDLEQDLPG